MPTLYSNVGYTMMPKMRVLQSPTSGGDIRSKIHNLIYSICFRQIAVKKDFITNLGYSTDLLYMHAWQSTFDPVHHFPASYLRRLGSLHIHIQKIVEVTKKKCYCYDLVIGLPLFLPLLWQKDRKILDLEISAKVLFPEFASQLWQKTLKRFHNFGPWGMDFRGMVLQKR